jgi:DNA replication protein DnaC
MIDNAVRTFKDIAANVRPGRGHWAVEDEDAPAVMSRRARPTLAGLQMTHPDLTVVIARVRAWGQAVNAARHAMNDPADETLARPPSLILTGPNGTGKTHLARVIQWGMVDAALDEDGRPLDDLVAPSCRWFAAADLLARLGNERDGDGYSYAGRPGQMVGSAPFVIVDDVAAELTIPYVAYQAQESERQIRYHLFFDWCAENRVPVVLTTNLAAAGPDSDLARHVGPRAWSRLMQMCPAGYILSLWNVPDYRLIAGGRDGGGRNA